MSNLLPYAVNKTEHYLQSDATATISKKIRETD